MWPAWTSLSEVMPQLAEAAPDAFLHAVQKGVEGSDPVLGKLFVDDRATIGASSPHPGLLWALEGLAWSPEHFGLVADLLARLAELDPGGQLGNRPSASLLWPLPPVDASGLSATPGARLAVLKSLTVHHADVGWSLLLSLLPETHSVGMYAHKPRFRSFDKSSDTVSPQEYWQVVDGVIALMLSLADKSPGLWPDLIDQLPNIPAENSERKSTNV